MNIVVRSIATKLALLGAIFIAPVATAMAAKELAVVTNRGVDHAYLVNTRSSTVASGYISLRRGKAQFELDTDVLRKPAKAGDFVFIHGYNRDAYRASKLALALGASIGQRAVLFSWPSFGRVDRYLQDRANAEWAASDLARWFASSPELRTMPIVAHSMGSVVLLEALREVAPNHSPKRIVLMASDIDKDRFVRVYQPMLQQREICTLVVLADNDKALNASERINGEKRLGAWVDMPALNGLDVMDVSSVNETFVGHEYFKDNNEITRGLRTWLDEAC